MTVDSRAPEAETEAHGESLLPVYERLIVSSGDGIFDPLPPETVTTEGEVVTAGQVFGVIRSLSADVEVRSVFTGFLMGLLVKPGERVRVGQPVAWLRIMDTAV